LERLEDPLRLEDLLPDLLSEDDRLEELLLLCDLLEDLLPLDDLLCDPLLLPKELRLEAPLSLSDLLLMPDSLPTPESVTESVAKSLVVLISFVVPRSVSVLSRDRT